MKCCIFCDEQVWGNAAGVFGEVMHPECEVQFFREYDAATGESENDILPDWDLLA